MRKGKDGRERAQEPSWSPFENSVDHGPLNKRSVCCVRFVLLIPVTGWGDISEYYLIITVTAPSAEIKTPTNLASGGQVAPCANSADLHLPRGLTVTVIWLISILKVFDWGRNREG